MNKVTAIRHARTRTPDPAAQGHFAYDAVSAIDRVHFWYRNRNERILKLVADSFPNYKTISFLEVGSGAGNVIGYLSESGMQDVSGCEVNPRGISLSRSRFPHIPVIASDLDSLKNKTDRKFDAIGFFDCLEHIEDDKTALLKAKQYLKPGGKIFITVPAHDWLWSRMDEIYGHYRRYSRSSLTDVFAKAGAHEVTARYMMAPLVPLLLLRILMVGFLPTHLDHEATAEILKDELKLPSPILNQLLVGVLKTEQHLLGNIDLNFGGSLIAVATFN